MPQKKRPLNREAGVLRDASLLVIASEDKYAVECYFAHFKTRKVQIVVSPTADCNSAPQHVKERLDQFIRDNAIEPGDTFWLCIDKDRWGEELISDVCRECFKRDYKVAISSPCFELWVLLHHEGVAREPAMSCTQVAAKLKQLLGGYRKQCCRSMSLGHSNVLAAVSNAKQLDTDESLVPAHNVTRVYKIIEELIEKDSIEFALPIEKPASS